MADVGGAHTELSPDKLDLIKTFELLYFLLAQTKTFSLTLALLLGRRKNPSSLFFCIHRFSPALALKASLPLLLSPPIFIQMAEEAVNVLNTKEFCVLSPQSAV